MSTFMNQARARTLRPTAGLPRPRLTIVPKVAVRAPRIPFALLVVTVLAAGLIGLLLLNTALQRGAYAVTALQQTSSDLSLRQQNLQTEVAALEAPQRISQRAIRLGMVAGDSPAFLSLKTGKVIGVPQAGTRAQRPAIGLVSTATSHSSAPVPPAPARARLNAKLARTVADDAPSLTSGAVRVAKQHPGHRGRPTERKPGDTRSTSTDPRAPRDTNNTSNTSNQESQQSRR